MRVLSGNRAPMFIADRDQAGYFHELLGRKRAELDERIDKLHVELTRLDPVDDAGRSGVHVESSGRLIVKLTR